jgi:hypothetical protein
MNELIAGLIGGGITALIFVAYVLFGAKKKGPPKDPFADDAAAQPRKESVEKEIEVIKNEVEKDRPKVDLRPIDIDVINTKLDRLRAKYKKLK